LYRGVELADKRRNPTAAAARSGDERMVNADRGEGRVRAMNRLICLLAAAIALLTACATSPDGPPGTYYKCNRNGDREQRAACEP
jgi:hypothetical protein